MCEDENKEEKISILFKKKNKNDKKNFCVIYIKMAVGAVCIFS